MFDEFTVKKHLTKNTERIALILKFINKKTGANAGPFVLLKTILFIYAGQVALRQSFYLQLSLFD
jgi:hypothetical protein